MDGKLYKTKLCGLYEKGHCPRQQCSFAHGDAELRRFSNPSFNGRRDYRSGDLRDKLERRRSPLRRYSPRRDARDWHASRGHSPSESGEQRSERKRHKKQHFDAQSDRSGSVKVSDRSEDVTKNTELKSPEPRSDVGKQLRQAQAEIDALNDHKYHLKVDLKKRGQEVDSLTSRIEELENRWFQEIDEYKRITSKIEKFVKAHKRHSRLQDELKRSHDLLEMMGDQLTSDATGLGVNENIPNINIVTDGETKGGGSKKTIRLEKHSEWSEQYAQFDNDDEIQRDRGSDSHKILSNGIKSKKGKIDLSKAASDQKLKGRESGFSLPLTSMAAHAIEGIETADQEKDDIQVAKETLKELDKRPTNGTLRFPFPLPLPLPPPPPLPQNAYSQYRGDDENIDAVVLEDDVFDVDVV